MVVSLLLLLQILTTMILSISVLSFCTPKKPNIKERRTGDSIREQISKEPRTSKEKSLTSTLPEDSPTQEDTKRTQQDKSTSVSKNKRDKSLAARKEKNDGDYKKPTEKTPVKPKEKYHQTTGEESNLDSKPESKSDKKEEKLKTQPGKTDQSFTSPQDTNAITNCSAETQKMSNEILSRENTGRTTQPTVSTVDPAH